MPRLLRRLFSRGTKRKPATRPSSVGRFQPSLESMEERANPVAVTFVPQSVVAVHPLSVPPTALVQFNPLYTGGVLPPPGGSVTSPIEVNGAFEQNLWPVPSPILTPGTLDLNFHFTGKVTESVSLSGVYSASFAIDGEIKGLLDPPGSAPAWVFAGSFHEVGAVSVSASGVGAFKLQADQKTENWDTTSPSASPWVIVSSLVSKGTFVPDVLAPTPTFSFSSADEFKLEATPPGILPSPTTISGSSEQKGTATAIVTSPGPIGGPTTVHGKTAYSERLREVVTPPFGPSVTVSQAFDTEGAFKEEVW